MEVHVTHTRWFVLFVAIVGVSAVATPGRYFTDWCWAVAVFSVMWLGTGTLLVWKGWIRR